MDKAQKRPGGIGGVRPGVLFDISVERKQDEMDPVVAQPVLDRSAKGK